MKIECPECETKLVVPASQGGQKMRCPDCSAVFLVPKEQPVARRVDDDEEDRPRPKIRKSKSGSGLGALIPWLIIGAGVLAVIVVLVVIGYVAYGGGSRNAATTPPASELNKNRTDAVNNPFKDQD